MYVILVILVIFIAALLFMLALVRMAVRNVRKRQAMAVRLAAAEARAEARAEQADQARRVQAETSQALTTVLPAIIAEERAPRRVA